VVAALVGMGTVETVFRRVIRKKFEYKRDTSNNKWTYN